MEIEPNFLRDVILFRSKRDIDIKLGLSLWTSFAILLFLIFNNI